MHGLKFVRRQVKVRPEVPLPPGLPLGREIFWNKRKLADEGWEIFAGYSIHKTVIRFG